MTTTTRRILGIFLLVCFAVSALLVVGIYGSGIQLAKAEEIVGFDHYFGQQLTTEGMEFYLAMEDMAHIDASGTSIFMRGEDYDLVAHGRVSQQQLIAYANGDMSLLNAMGAARDAFYTDYDDIFYVDFGYLSLRVTQDTNGYHAWLGKGRADTYFVEGINAENVQEKIDEYVAARDAIIAEVQKAKANDKQIKSLGDKDLAEQVAKIREAHRQVAINTVYRLEMPYEWETSDDDYSSHVRTSYGAFVKGKALCEGYARAFKAIMDELEIPCVLVNGVYRHGNNQEELHMWTHVQLLDGKWYAVDPTFDDLNFDDREKWPVDEHPGMAKRTTPLNKELIPDAFAEEVEDEDGPYADEMDIYYNEDYFLKGASYMNNQHATSPYKSEAEYPFTYPELAEHNFGMEVTLSHGGLFKVVQAPHDGSMTSTDIYVSVFIDGKWCGYAEAAKKGYYILVRYEGDFLPEKLQNHQDLSHVGDNEILDPVRKNIDTTTVWAYLNPFPMYSSIIEGEGYTVMQDTAKSTGFEFALTTRAPREFDGNETDLDKIAEMTTFTGDLTMFEARSGFIPVKYGDPTYQPAPHIVRSTPTHTCKLMLSSFREADTYDITIEYDQVLKFIGDATELKMSVYGVRATGEILKGTHAIKLSEVVDMDSVQYDLGEDLPDGTYRCGTISFRFTPYKEWAYDNVEYIFNFNLEGVRSHKQVNPATYCAGYECEALCYKAFGYHWNVFGQPQLLEDEDLSRTGWKDSNGNNISDTKSRLALVVTRTTQKQEDTMNDLIGSEFDEDILESFTYNISLTICKSIVLETGQGVRVCVGFPEGFTYDDSMNGVAFKAYHFTRDKWDNITGVEEIECTVTPLGLVLLCKSFSPFAIVAATADPADVVTDKSVMVSSNSGGTANGDVVEDNHNTKKIFYVQEGETRTVAIKANAGYIIEAVIVNGVSQTVAAEATTMSLTLNYNELSASNMIEVKFVPQKIKAAEEARGEKLLVQQLKDTVITVAKKSVSVSTGEVLKIEATVTSYGSTSYQWYKNGEAVRGQNTNVLLIENAQAEDAGEYYLKTFTTSGTASVSAQSDKVTVSVAEKPGLDAKGKMILAISIVAVFIAAVAAVAIVGIVKSKKKSK